MSDQQYTLQKTWKIWNKDKEKEKEEDFKAGESMWKTG